MSETELSVICKNCGSEVSPYVTECPYCGARLRKRAPKLERRGEVLEPQRPKRRRRRLLPRREAVPWAEGDKPYATIAAILASIVILLIQKATGYALSWGGLVVPLDTEWWRYLTAPFAYVDVGYLFVVAIGLAIFSTGVERRLGTLRTAVLLLACGALGMIAANAVAEAQSEITVVGGGNGMALGAVAAWFALRRSESSGAIDEEYDLIGVVVAAVVLIALPIFAPTADFVGGLVGGAVGGLAGLAASAFHTHSE
jgi:membrane associated rhomboid family serine protease